MRGVSSWVVCGSLTLVLGSACSASIDDPAGSLLTGGGPKPSRGPSPSPNPSPTGGPSPSPSPTGSPSPSPSPTTPAGDPNKFACDPSVARPPDELRRLSRDELMHTVRDLMGPITQAENAQAMTDLGPAFDRIPADQLKPLPNEKHGGYTKLDQDLNQPHVEALYEIGTQVATILTANATRLERLVGRCATDNVASNDARCIDDFIRRFGERALRRAVDDQDVAFYRGVYAGTAIDPVGVADVVAVMLNAPEFFYRFEHGTAAVGSSTTTYALSAYELASRLSYQLTETMPDDPLMAAARDGSLLRDEVWQAQVDRMLALPQARDAALQFYREWLWLDEVPRLDGLVGSPLMDAFAGNERPTAELRDAVVGEVLSAAEHFAFDSRSTLKAFFQSNTSFARDPLLARIYGVPVWDGSGTPPEMTQPQRAGLLTRAAFLVTGTPNTRPIKKGLFVRKALLCDFIAPPPDNAAAMPPVLRPDATTREVVEELTEQSGTSCAGCHKRAINPMGFATENFDALARPRSVQRLFQDDGTPAGERAISTRTRPYVSFDDEREVADIAEASRYLADSGRLEACFARQYLRYTMGRVDDPSRDACALEPLRVALKDGQPMLEAMKAFLASPSMRQRNFAF